MPKTQNEWIPEIKYPFPCNLNSVLAYLHPENVSLCLTHARNREIEQPVKVHVTVILIAKDFDKYITLAGTKSP